ncbi:MAG TPA: efflux RND transporter permease subunit, partial [Fodinibius sp.]|nr:efflux RND transporter permease subunit [Fodinibius sp.]
MFKKFIDRPVLATVISILFVLLGIVGIIQLPITRFPDIAPPSVSVSASYTGADAETIAESVLLPLEEDINGVRGMTYMESQASTGSGTIQIYFEQGTDPDQAAVNVNNRTSKALSDLPEETVTSGISVSPRQAGVVMTLNVYSIDPAAFNETFVNVYVTREITRELLRIDGVASASKIGSRNYAMRIWLNPNKMNAYGLVPSDIEQAVNDQNFTMAPGQFGQNSDQAFQRVIKYTGRFTSREEFENIVVKTQEDGAILHLKDVARVELGPTNANNVNRVDGQPGTTMNITQNVGANAREIDIAVREKMEELAQDFPSGIEYNISYSVRNQIDESVNQVIYTLLEALLLVFIVVFIFLQDLRSTIIPAIAVPVSLVGAFFFIYLLGFSINVLTLFALVLSIGIVVDDAIIVVEAVHEKLESTNLTAKNATFLAMEEITPAILSITMVMAAVFLPIGFMSGSSGIFYQQFGYTIAIAIIISAVNALTLSPALCALFLKNTHEAEVTAVEPQTLRGKAKGYINRFFVAFNTSFNTMKYKYISAVNYLIRKWRIGIGGLILVILTGFLFMYITPTGFIPTEDDGFISYSIKLPPSSSLARTTNILNEVNDILQDREEILTRSSSSGYNAVDGTNSPSYAVGYISMYPHGERKGITDRGEFIDTLRQELSGISGADINIF